MKRISRAVPVLCTLLLLGIGAFLPRLAALALDRQLAERTVLLEEQSIVLVLEQGMELFQALELFQGAYSQIELSDGYRMKAEEVETAALEVRGALPIFETLSENPEITPMLLTSRDVPGLSSVFWRCVWDSGSGTQEILWLDDQSGQMVSMIFFEGRMGSLSVSGTSSVLVEADDSFSPEAVIAVAEYCELHYPVDAAELRFDREIDAMQWYTMTLRKSNNGQEETCSVPIRFADGWLFFNA